MTTVKEPHTARSAMILAIANSYGNVDLTKTTLDRRYKHVRGKRLQPLCRKLGIKYAEAVVAWKDSGSYWKPTTDGVVVSATSAGRLEEAVVARQMRTKPARVRRQVDRKRRKEERIQRLAAAGIDNPDSRTAEWYLGGEIDEYEARLIQFKAYYRHSHSDYDEQISEMHEEADSMHGEERRLALMFLRGDAREGRREYAVPFTWAEYLAEYAFPFPEIAERLSQILKSPQAAHPVWFCEAILAVKREQLPLDTLAYPAIRDAIAKWKEHRFGSNSGMYR